MASKKDMRRADLVIPYQAPKPKETQELSSTLSSTLPMAVMLTRNRFIGWAAVIYSVQNWLGESEDQKKTATTPGYFNVTMSPTTDSAIEAIVSLVSAGTSTINNPFEMASKKDMRRADLVIPYQAPKPKETQELSSTLSSTLPMAVMLTRNRFIGWAAVIYSVQNWLGESEDQKKTATTPGYFNVTMSLVSLLVAYLPLFLPPKLAAAATGTAPAAPLPLQ
ncbi:hypothetical protein BN1708_015024 [Verticillium longisporum]|uniref:Uncharacterized protein n=3 Tax=Verticillium TaxID=1036719 RepID=A0A0G4M101_VERLO|nr:hypothetical protein BN1708_015024 [Verticillium longisporum]